MTKSVLIVEDDSELCIALSRQLKKHYEVSRTNSVHIACSMLDTHQYDVLVIDRLLIDGDGKDVIEYARCICPQTRILVISGLSSLHDRLLTYTAGADDYVVKPFSTAELDHKLNMLASMVRTSKTNTYHFGGITLSDSGEIAAESLTSRLRPKESALLRQLLIHAPAVMSKDQLIEAVWPDCDQQPTYTTLDVYIRRIRIALGSHAHALRTVRGYGYTISKLRSSGNTDSHHRSNTTLR